MGLFDRESRVERVSENIWKGFLGDKWCIGEVPNGGYQMAVAAKALSEALPHKEPLSINGFYLAPSVVGECEIQVEILKEGRSSSHGIARLYQDGEQKIQITAVYSDLESLHGETLMETEAPDLPEFKDCTLLPKQPFLRIQETINQAVKPGLEKSLMGDPQQGGEWTGWIEYTDHADVDVFGLLYFADAYPPPVFTYFGPTGWVPTVELTVQVRGKPKPGPLKVRFTTKMLTQGVMEEDGELWDCEGNLVAVSRQMAKFRLPKK